MVCRRRINGRGKKTRRPGLPELQGSVQVVQTVSGTGNAVAQTNLGLMYDNGLGVEQDYVQAHKWYNIAGTNGDETGRKSKDDVEKQMNPDQIAEAQRLAKEWMEEHGKDK